MPAPASCTLGRPLTGRLSQRTQAKDPAAYTSHQVNQRSAMSQCLYVGTSQLQQLQTSQPCRMEPDRDMEASCATLSAPYANSHLGLHFEAQLELPLEAAHDDRHTASRIHHHHLGQGRTSWWRWQQCLLRESGQSLATRSPDCLPVPGAAAAVYTPPATCTGAQTIRCWNCQL